MEILSKLIIDMWLTALLIYCTAQAVRCFMNTVDIQLTMEAIRCIGKRRRVRSAKVKTHILPVVPKSGDTRMMRLRHGLVDPCRHHEQHQSFFFFPGTSKDPPRSALQPPRHPDARPMIRPRWTVQRQCLCLYNCVRRDRPTDQARYTTSSSGDQQWPLLRRKSRPANGSNPASSTDSNELQKSSPSPPTAATKGDSKNMLLITGLSPNLRPADFFRLAPNDLSSWQAGIKRGAVLPIPRTPAPFIQILTQNNSSATSLPHNPRADGHLPNLLRARRRRPLLRRQPRPPTPTLTPPSHQPLGPLGVDRTPAPPRPGHLLTRRRAIPLRRRAPLCCIPGYQPRQDHRHKVGGCPRRCR